MQNGRFKTSSGKIEVQMVIWGLNLSFVKDIYVIGDKITNSGLKTAI